eukprot:CAMPEP_0116135216 /NCGR_PEP_ID=MMETSP0329-20121206/11074_1 /TAXON_ID=697910 /ORGANISM="Pseudo-nitzschia arenysensis, Strain B593" /LENGTH=247 /DNA_ID=CAMNT_0003630005 /DNA_START=41 /DNA_END=784 /DNA_ORIENTATION=-
MKRAQGKPSKAKRGSMDRHNITSEQDMGSPMVSKKEFPALTTFNIQVHRKLHGQEAINTSSSTPQDFIHGIETLFVPGSRVKGRRFLWKTIVEVLDGNSFIFGQVHDACNDSSTLIIMKAPAMTTKNTKSNCFVDAKEQPIAKAIRAPDTSPTGSLTSTLSSTPRSNDDDDDDDYEQQRLKTSSHIRRLVESIIRRRRKEEWMSSLREPTKYNDKMEMVFFDRLPVEKKGESFQEVFVFEGSPMCEA